MNIGTTLKIGGIVTVVLVLLFALSLFELWTQLARYKNYWDRQNQVSVTAGSLQYVALGDSTAQGIGATHPAKGYVGLIANNLSEERGKPVHTVNLSKSGAKIRDVLDRQLPELNTLQPDVITIEIGANDMINFEPQKFEQEMDQLMERLPKQAVMSDIPYFGGSRFKSKQSDVEAANKIMYRLATKHGIKLALLHQKVKQNSGIHTLASDLFHPSNAGYRENWAPVFLDRL